MSHLFRDISADNLTSYFGGIIYDAEDQKAASLRHAIWRDLRYKLWKLSDEDFEEAIAAIRALLGSYDHIAENKADKNMEKLKQKPSF